MLKAVLQLVLCALFLAWAGVGAAFPQAADRELTASPPQPVAFTPDEVHPVWQDFTPQFTPQICPFGIFANANPEEFQCGYVLVPEDRQRAESRLIQLAVLRIVSTSDTPPAGAVVRLTGGPGSGSLGRGRVAAYMLGNNAPVRAAADLIFFDQRGTGYSEGRFCRGEMLAYQYGLPTLGGGLDQMIADRKACLAEARERGIFVDGYTNWQNALDVRDIRRALGYDSWTLFGVSYGTELGQAVMRFDREGTRAAILDSVVPAGLQTNDIDALLANGFRSALNAVDDMCTADAGCAAVYGGTLSERFVAAIKAYDDEPLILSGLNFDQSAKGALYMDASLAGSSVFQALYSKRIYGDLPALLTVLESRDVETLRAYTNTIGYPIDHRWGHGMSLTINCRAGFRETPDAPAPPGPAAPELMGVIGGTSTFQVCGGMYDSAPDPSVRPLVSDIPTLVVTGAVDPITPPYYADIAMQGLSNAQRVDFPFTGHGGLSSNWSTCGRDLFVAFITDPEAPIDTTCADNIAVPDMLVNLRETKAPYRFALDLQRGSYPSVAIGATGALFAVIAAFLLAPIARRIDGAAEGDHGRARLLTLAGGAATLLGTGLAVKTIIDAGTANQASLPVGVPSSISLGGWIALVGTILCLAAVWRTWASRGAPGRSIGTSLAIILAACAAVTLLVFLFSIDAGPAKL